MSSVLDFGEEIEGLLEEVATDEGMHDYMITKKGGSEQGDGFASTITFIDITGKDVENKSKHVSLVMKTAKKGEALRAQMDIRGFFEREIYLYDTVLPAFRMLEDENSIPVSSFGPKFYKWTETICNEALVFEDLNKSDHRLYDRRLPMDEAHVELVMMQYGRLHALSFALRDQNPEKFKNIYGLMDDVLMKTMVESKMKLTFIQKCLKAKEILEPNTDAKTIEVYGNFVETIEPFFCSLLSAVDEYSVILHGDCWTNNMLFKYEDENDSTKPTKVTFIDFQCSRIASPIIDLAYFFYCCSSKKIIDNFSYYMQLYYNSFSTYLQKFGSDPDKVYPYSVFQQHWKKYARYGLIFGILLIHIMLTEKNEAVDLDNEAETGDGIKDAFEYQIANSAIYNDRIRHLIGHFVENNFI